VGYFFISKGSTSGEMAAVPLPADDKNFIQNLITNGLQVVQVGHPGRKAEVVAILNRVLANGRQRGGPTKVMLISLGALCPQQPALRPAQSKPEVSNILLGVLQNPIVAPPVLPPQVPINPARAGGPPQGPVPLGWGRFAVGGVVGAPPPPPPDEKALLRLKRGQLGNFPLEKQLDLLLKEQEHLEEAAGQGDQPLVQYIKTHIQEMSGNPDPLPPMVADDWLFYIYGQVLSEETTVANFEKTTH
jgi:hypothetical protein